MNYQERLFRQRQGYECPPVLLAASLVISALSAVTSVQGQKANAAAQENYQNQQVNANTAAAAVQEGAIRDQQAQDAESRARELNKASLANQRAISTARAATADVGQNGGSVDALLAEYDMQYGQYKEATMRQGALNNAAVTSNIAALHASTYSSNLATSAPIQQAQPFAAAVNFAGEALGAYRAYNPNSFKIGGGKG